MEINPIKIENTIEDLLCDTKNAQYTHMPTPTILLEALLALPSFTNKYKKNKMTLINNESLHDTINISRKLQNTSHLEEVYLIFSDAGLRLQLQNPNPNLFVTSFLKRSCFTTLRMPSSNPSRCISITIKLPEFIAAVRVSFFFFYNDSITVVCLDTIIKSHSHWKRIVNQNLDCMYKAALLGFVYAERNKVSI